MKKSTVKIVCHNKIRQWLDTIEDKELVKLLERDVIIAGGAIASMLLDEKVNDYDIYCRTQETTYAVAKYYVEKYLGHASTPDDPTVCLAFRQNIKGYEEDRVTIHFPGKDGILGARPADPLQVLNEALEGSKEKSSYRPIFLSENAITLTNKIQVVIRFYGEPDEIHENYDFVHAMCYYDFAKRSLVLHQKALECLLAKNLIYAGSLYPLCSLFRVRKFLNRGWRISAGQLLKIAFQISAIDLTDVELLKEQLIGVDRAYMSQLLHELENKEPSQKIDEIYLMGLLDKIFEEV